MKTIFFLLVSVACFAQQPAVVDPILVQHWPDVTLVKPELRKVYKVLLRKDHAIYAENLPDSVWVTICYGCVLQAPTEPPIVQVDTVDSEGLTFSSTWTRHGLTNAPGWYKRTISYSNVGEVSYTFTGTKIEIIGERGLNNGTATVTIGTATHTASFKGTQLLPFNALSITVPRGTYPVTIKPNGDGNVLIDYIIVTK